MMKVWTRSIPVNCKEEKNGEKMSCADIVISDKNVNKTWSHSCMRQVGRHGVSTQLVAAINILCFRYLN